MVPDKYKKLPNSNLIVTVTEVENQDSCIKKVKITNPYKDEKDPKKIAILDQISEWQKKIRDEWK